jgi:hypothetical protein
MTTMTMCLLYFCRLYIQIKKIMYYTTTQRILVYLYVRIVYSVRSIIYQRDTQIYCVEFEVIILSVPVDTSHSRKDQELNRILIKIEF